MHILLTLKVTAVIPQILCDRAIFEQLAIQSSVFGPIGVN